MWMLAVQNSDELIYIWSLYTCTAVIQRFFPELSRTVSFNFQDFPEPKWFSRTFQFPECSRKKSRTFQEAWESCKFLYLFTFHAK